MPLPIIDIHCDLLIYLTQPNSNIYNENDIGCAIPYLKKGGVKLQVMAIFAPTQAGSSNLGLQQSVIYNNLITDYSTPFYQFKATNHKNFNSNSNIAAIASIENASAFCDETMPLQQGFLNLETIIKNTGNVFYIGLTHHTENRFGGGNYTTIGLKNDGKALIDYIADKNIAIDFSHTSDQLAYDILNYISQKKLDIPIIASHSNYRSVFKHSRNLPDEIAKEICLKKGLIGVNFLRAFVNNDNPNALYNHIEYGIKLGGIDTICYGADFFYNKSHPDKSRIPFFFKNYENASCYSTINKQLTTKFDNQLVEKISYKNVLNFFNNYAMFS